MRRARLRRAGVGVLWYFVPALAILAVSAYVIGAVVWHANPPVVPVAGISMKPTLEPGDLVFLHGVDPRTLRKGDIIAFHVTKTDRAQYDLPAELIHRIIKVQSTPTGMLFRTKGDNNAGPDVVVTHGNEVVGRLAGRAPGLGYPLLFFRSRQGTIFIGAAILIAIAYFLLGVYEDRRATVMGTTQGIQAVLAETAQLKEALAGSGTTTAQWGWPTDTIRHEVRQLRDHDAGRDATMRELVGAIGEYGVHLRSHTSVMQNLAATTAELHRATAELGSTLAGPAARTRGSETLPVIEASPSRPVLHALPSLGAPAAPTPAAPLAVPVELLEQRMMLEARTARVDRILERVAARSSVS